MATRTYYETPGAVAELNGSDILVVQQGTGTATTGGFAEMKKTTLEDMKGFMVGGIDEEVSQLTSDLTELNETVEAHDALIDDVTEESAGTVERLHGYDFRKVDRGTLFVLDGDGEQNLMQMMDSVEAYPQDAIMLSLEPIIPTASTHNFGIRGQIACDDSYLYVCTAENTWKKIPLNSL